MAYCYVAVCDTFDVPNADLDSEMRTCTGILLNRIRRSVRVPGRGLNFEVLYRDRRIDGPESEFTLEFHVVERDLKTIFEKGAPALIAACKTWIDRHGIGLPDGPPRVLPIEYFADPRQAEAAA